MRSTVNTYPFQPAKVASVTFTERIQALVAKAGRDDQSKRGLAKRLGVSHTTLARYAAGGQPTLDTAIGIADALGLTLDELAGREPERSRRPRVVSIDGVLYQPVSGLSDEPPEVARRGPPTGGPEPDAGADGAALREQRRRGPGRTRPRPGKGA